MATLSGAASLDEYYDLTAEEEALLCQIDAQIPPLATQATGADSSTNSILFVTPQSHVPATVSSRDNFGIGKAGPRQGPAAAGTGASADTPVAKDVLYPDRMSCPRAILTRPWARPTD